MVDGLTQSVAQWFTGEMNDAPGAEHISVKEMANEVGVAPMTIYRLLHEGEIPYHRIGKLMRVKRHDWKQYLAEAWNGGRDAS